MVGAVVGEYVARPIGDVLEQAMLWQAKIAADTIKGGGIPFQLAGYH